MNECKPQHRPCHNAGRLVADPPRRVSSPGIVSPAPLPNQSVAWSIISTLWSRLPQPQHVRIREPLSTFVGNCRYPPARGYHPFGSKFFSQKFSLLKKNPSRDKSSRNSYGPALSSVTDPCPHLSLKAMLSPQHALDAVGG